MGHTFNCEDKHMSNNNRYPPTLRINSAGWWDPHGKLIATSPDLNRSNTAYVRPVSTRRQENPAVESDGAEEDF